MNMQYLDVVTTIPAQPGWEAIYVQGRRDEGRFDTKPLVGWALVNIIPNPILPFNQIVAGLVVGEINSSVLTFADQAGRFIGYNYPECTTNWSIEVKKNKLLRPKENIQLYRLVRELMPALPGWEAVYEVSRRTMTVEKIPLIGWATIVSGNVNSVIGLVTEETPRFNLNFVDHTKKFMGYNYPGCVIEWEERLRPN